MISGAINAGLPKNAFSFLYFEVLTWSNIAIRYNCKGGKSPIKRKKCLLIQFTNMLALCNIRIEI